MARWKLEDKIGFDTGNEYVYGTIREVTEVEGRDTLYSIRWDDGYEDGAGNVWAEWELDDLEDSINEQT